MLKSIEGSFSNPQTSADHTALRGQWFGLVTAFPQPEKTPAAFVSGHCCPGNPKVKWFGLDRSPNVSHPTLSHGSLQSRQDISSDGL